MAASAVASMLDRSIVGTVGIVMVLRCGAFQKYQCGWSTLVSEYLIVRSTTLPYLYASVTDLPLLTEWVDLRWSF